MSDICVHRVMTACASARAWRGCRPGPPARSLDRRAGRRRLAGPARGGRARRLRQRRRDVPLRPRLHGGLVALGCAGLIAPAVPRARPSGRGEARADAVAADSAPQRDARSATGSSAADREPRSTGCPPSSPAGSELEPDPRCGWRRPNGGSGPWSPPAVRWSPSVPRPAHPAGRVSATAEGLEDGVIDRARRSPHAQTVGRLDRMVDDLVELSRAAAAMPAPGRRRPSSCARSRRRGRRTPAARRRRGRPHLQVAGRRRPAGVSRQRRRARPAARQPRGQRRAQQRPGRLGGRAGRALADGQVSRRRGVRRHPRADDRRTSSRRAGGPTPAQRPDAGAGLGLAIAGHRRSHAGSISVANVDAGCLFEVALPAADVGRLQDDADGQ